MKEIGGYFELECGKNVQYHKDGMLLNSARNCLRYFIKCIGIKKIHVPDYTCPVIFDAVKAENCEIIFYGIDNVFLPKNDLPKDGYIIYNNYFGICRRNVDYLAETYPNLIVDNAQAFYAELRGIASFYSPRKFFGVPDGGILLTKEELPIPEEREQSYNRCLHLLKRIDMGANAGFRDFQKNDDFISELQILKMSYLTKTLMGNIDYETAKQKRLENFNYLHKVFDEVNELKIELQENDVPMVYPLLLRKGDVRENLIANKIYVAKYWPNVECNFSKYILPLPIDQRYSAEDMEFIVKTLKDNL